MPWPSAAGRNTSSSASAGSPNKASAPCCSNTANLRNSACTLAEANSARSSPRFSGLSRSQLSSALRSFKSSSNKPSRSATLNAANKAACWLSVNSSKLPSSSGPISLNVVRSGKPCSPCTSHRVNGTLCGLKFSHGMLAIRSATLPLGAAGWPKPDKSPLISAANTLTPARLNDSAKRCKVTVLPVPVAPATKPCRLHKRHAWPTTSPVNVWPIFSCVSDMPCSCFV